MTAILMYKKLSCQSLVTCLCNENGCFYAITVLIKSGDLSDSIHSKTPHILVFLGMMWYSRPYGSIESKLSSIWCLEQFFSDAGCFKIWVSSLSFPAVKINSEAETMFKLSLLCKGADCHRPAWEVSYTDSSNSLW